MALEKQRAGCWVVCCENIGSPAAGILRMAVSIPDKLPQTTLQLSGIDGILASGDHNTALTVVESRLAWVLMFHAGNTVPTAYLMEHVWGYESWASSQVLYVTLGRLREKSSALGVPKWWSARRGFGYLVHGELL